MAAVFVHWKQWVLSSLPKPWYLLGDKAWLMIATVSCCCQAGENGKIDGTELSLGDWKCSCWFQMTVSLAHIFEY